MAEDIFKDYVVLMIALLKIAVPFALISCYSTPFELRHEFRIAKVKRLFVAPQFLSKVLPVAQEAGIVKEVVYVMNAEVEPYESLEGLIRKANVANIPRRGPRIVSKNTLAWLFFSSGTTGLPKGILCFEYDIRGSGTTYTCHSCED